jgi:hypothetical protein
VAATAGRPALDPLGSRTPDPDLLIADAHTRARQRRRRYGAVGVAALVLIAAAYVFSAGNSEPAPPRGDGAQGGSATAQESGSEVRQVLLREPVELDGMTFVVNGLAPVQSIPTSSGQPLTAETGRDLWLLTVSVRNDRSAVEADPFCRGARGRLRMGAELWIRSGYVHHWQKESRSIAGNDRLCGEIQPGSTETYQLYYTVSKHEAPVTGVELGHRAPASDHRSFAFVASSSSPGFAIPTYHHGVWRVPRGDEPVAIGPD